MAALKKACKNPKMAIYKALHSSDILFNIVDFLCRENPTEQPGEVKFNGKTYYVTNLPAAICHSNAAAAFSQLAGSKPSSTEVEPGPETEDDRKVLVKKIMKAGQNWHCGMRNVPLLSVESMRKVTCD